MPDMVEGVEAVTVHVSDIRPARNFYGQVLGLKEVSYDEAGRRAVFSLPGTTMTLRMHVQGPDEGGREPGTVTGVILTHHDPAGACAEITRRGGTVTVAPHELTPPGFRTMMAVIADPDGNEFVLRSKPVPTG